MSDVQVKPLAGDGIFAGYTPDDSCFDEIFGGAGSVRPGWSELLSAVTAMGRPELMRRWLQAQEEIYETGIAQNIFDDADGVVRPWELDLLPQLISAGEWSTLSAGLIQRAELLNRLLADLYGPQESLASGLLPADWLFSHPGYRRVFHGQTPADGRFLQFYAADLARAPDGRWWVVGDRTDAPLGIGYALENRIVTSRMLPHAIRKFRIERLAPFFKQMQDTLAALAPAHRENPRIVLLTHSSSGPDYFEDAYLARYLGYILVEGGDLAVRDDHVYMKTLAGLLPVDVILRRVSDEYCDPLELRNNAGIGVPGLLKAARMGHVAIANALGSSLVESPSLIPFLPGIARSWLGDELRLPSVATWWCGQPGVRQRVTSRIEQGQSDNLSIRPAFRFGKTDATSVESLELGSPDKLAKQLESCPHAFIAQEAVRRSTSPAWCDNSPQRWHVALRVFLVASKDSYHVMPGGLVRLDRESAQLDRSVFSGNLSKDAWVQSDGPVKQVSLLATSKQQVLLRRSGAELPSRVADNLFWFGRGIERAQASCRLLRAVVSRLTGEGDWESSEEFACLIRCLASQGQIEPGFAVDGMKDRLPTIANVLPTSVVDEEQPRSLRSTVANAHRNASLVRDRLSLDSWRIVHHIERYLARAADIQRSTGVPFGSEPANGQVQRTAGNEDAAEVAGKHPFGLVELDELLDELVVNLSALDGLSSESMTRTPAWRFLELGKRLERSLHVVALVQSIPKTSVPEEGRILEAMLDVSDSIMTYRARYLAAVNRAAALDLLLTDETNPRSLSFQLAAIADHVTNLPRDESQPLGTPEERIAASLLHSVRMIEVDDLSAAGGERSKLGRFLQRVADQLPKLSDLVSHRYLIHAGVPRQMAEGRQSTR